MPLVIGVLDRALGEFGGQRYLSTCTRDAGESDSGSRRFVVELECALDKGYTLRFKTQALVPGDRRFASGVERSETEKEEGSPGRGILMLVSH
jgi:hypothetical protein